ncbi:MAG: aminopeptidase [Sphaerochaetaceae bacterium]|nr:aminopeptidase [Sphaerochaetaceae bacterium]
MAMTQLLEKYATTIVKDFLRLRTGEALSINTEEQDLEFAKLVANTALPITEVEVKIVVTEDGKPSQVIEFEPLQQTFRTATSYAMLRIARIEKEKEILNDDIETLEMKIDSQDLRTIQKLGHLAEPIFVNRRIAVPWCVAWVYDSDDDKGWSFIKELVEKNIQERSVAITYRRKYLEHSDVHKLHFSGEKTSFSIEIPEDSNFLGGVQSIGNSSRSYLCDPDFDSLSVIVDKDSLNGNFTATASILGKKEEVSFNYEKGVLKSCTPSSALRQLLSFDKNLRLPGYIKMGDKSFTLCLGGALVDSLGTTPEDENSFPSFFNTSLYTLKLQLENRLSVVMENCEGQKKEIVKKGLFLE